jgi:hypothetical protein
VSLAQRIESSSLPIMRLARLAAVPAHRLYGAANLDPDEIKRIEGVLRNAEAGKIPPGRHRALQVPA